MIDNRTIQQFLASAGFYRGRIDGQFGIKSRAAVDQALRLEGIDLEGWSHGRRMIAINQIIMREAKIEVGEVDGLMGPTTNYALECWQDHLRGIMPKASEVSHQPKGFPRQADMEKFFGKPGENHTRLMLPYPMRLAWDKSQIISSILINEKCAKSAGSALGKALDHYGHDRLKSLGLDLFGGCYANRPMRGGSKLSTHAFAAAIDINPEANQLRWGADRAAMAGPQCKAFLDFFEEEGWISLGRERNFDWMHVQAARL